MDTDLLEAVRAALGLAPSKRVAALQPLRGRLPWSVYEQLLENAYEPDALRGGEMVPHMIGLTTR